MVAHLMSVYRVSIRRSCGLIGMSRTVWYYQSVSKRDDAPIIMRMKEITETRVRYGVERVHTLLRREGYLINHKRTYRIYTEQGLALHRRRPKRRESASHRPSTKPAGEINEVWAMDFVSDALFNGRRIRALTVVDCLSRECLAIAVAPRLKTEDVTETLDRIAATRGYPMRIKTDNGSEFTSLQYDRWAYEHGITADYSRRGTPTDNAIIESFNGSLRDECLSVNWFLSLEDAREKIEQWRHDYNDFRPHSSLDDMTPNDYTDHLRGRKFPQSPGPGFG